MKDIDEELPQNVRLFTADAVSMNTNINTKHMVFKSFMNGSWI
jgi:hypothetical protein